MNPPPVERGTSAFRRTAGALFAAGFSTFALMYSVQPLLPELAAEFDVSAAQSSLAVSMTTGALALTLLLLGPCADRVGRKTLIVTSLAITAVLTLLSVVSPSWFVFLVMRTLAGVAFAGLPAIAMAYIGEEMSPRAVGLAMGIYVGGTAVGGMSGRLATAALTDVFDWRTAVGATGAFGLVTALLVALSLPRARRSRPEAGRAHGLLHAYRLHLGNPVLRRLYALGFLFMGVFIALYNYLTFRLVAPPYAMGHTAIGSVFLIYLVGMVSSPWAGTVAARVGHPRTLGGSLLLMLAGAVLTLFQPLSMIVCGVGLVTAGFFAAHAVASLWIGQQGGQHRAQAASLYIVFYYVGGSVTGTVAGLFWTRYAWSGVGVFVVALLLCALALLATLPRSSDAQRA